MVHAQRMGEYLRYRSALGFRLSELAILITAREWSQQVEWAIHAPIAQSAGIRPEVIEAIAQRRPPDCLSTEEVVVYEFSMQLHRNRQVSDTTWARALALFSEGGVVDLIGICGYYSFLAMVMNAARTEVPPSTTPPLP